MDFKEELEKFELSSVFTINFSWLKQYVESDNGMYTLMKNISNDEFQEIENSFYALQTVWKAWREAKAQAIPEGFVLVKKAHPDAIVHNQGLGLFKECQVIYGWDGKSKDFKDALNKGFYHGVKLGAKAVLETAIIKAQEQGHD